ncbi:MAG: ATP-binding protein [Candidatus Omnitrophota bacterium]|nr:ATP-binding protein [Candidatus Omnitrophota bacterium]
MNKLKIEIPNEFSFVRGVRVCVSNIASNFGFSDREAYQIETIVDELCNNAIEHGGGRNKVLKEKDAIKIECGFKPGELEFCVNDSGGEGFNLKDVLKRNKQLIQKNRLLDNLDKRGRGLLIIQRFVDELKVDTSKGGTAVKIIKKAKNLKE